MKKKQDVKKTFCIDDLLYATKRYDYSNTHLDEKYKRRVKYALVRTDINKNQLMDYIEDTYRAKQLWLIKFIERYFEIKTEYKNYKVKIVKTKK